MTSGGEQEEVEEVEATDFHVLDFLLFMKKRGLGWCRKGSGIDSGCHARCSGQLSPAIHAPASSREGAGSPVARCCSSISPAAWPRA